MILFALDLAGNRIYIENAHAGITYLCEECGTRLMAKNKGSERQHHYAHVAQVRFADTLPLAAVATLGG